MPNREVVLCHPVRTAIGTYAGSLKSTPATDLGAMTVKAVLDRSGLDSSRLSAVVMGNVIQAGNKMNPARQAAIHGGVPVEVPAAPAPRPSSPLPRKSGSGTPIPRSLVAWRTWTWRPT
jgi:acetyl-CoA C-acetyltransferase